MLSKQVTLSNLINDCVVLAKNAGRILNTTVQGVEQAFTVPETIDDKKARITEADYLIR